MADDPVFVDVSVKLTEREYLKYKNIRFMNGPGTVAAQMRIELGLPPEPRGWRKWKREHPDGS